MKHAYLIIAHTSFSLLQELLYALDDERNDLYVHLDSKACFDVKHLKANHSLLTVLPTRLDGRWGDYSLVQIELLLFNAAYANGPYGYYHLLSGVDYPIKSQDYIHDYCNRHQGLEFVGFAQNATDKEIKWRSQHYFLYSRDFQSSNLFKKVSRAIYARLQNIAGYRRIIEEVKKGCQWCSITHEFVGYILQNKDFIHRSFNHSYCPDEMFIQTLCWNSSFKERLYNANDEFEGCKRYIVWKDGAIQTLDETDSFKLINSDRWFARKFTTNGIRNIDNIKCILKES